MTAFERRERFYCVQDGDALPPANHPGRATYIEAAELCAKWNASPTAHLRGRGPWKVRRVVTFIAPDGVTPLPCEVDAERYRTLRSHSWLGLDEEGDVVFGTVISPSALDDDFRLSPTEAPYLTEAQCAQLDGNGAGGIEAVGSLTEPAALDAAVDFLTLNARHVPEGQPVEGTFWNGEPCRARRVRVTVGPPPAPTWWCAAHEGTERTAVEVTVGDAPPFYIDDEQGSGWYKVTVGRGSPHVGHRSLPVAFDKPVVAR